MGVWPSGPELLAGPWLGGPWLIPGWSPAPACQSYQDVLTWLISFHNEFHGGSSETVCQLFASTTKAEAEWKSLMLVKGWTQSAMGIVKLQKLCEDWLGQHYAGKYDSMNFFNQTKAVCRSLRRFGSQHGNGKFH